MTEKADRQEIPAPPWQRAPQRGPGRRRDPLTQEAIVETALKVLDADGLDNLSMRRVADELGTGAASLYWHVGSKDGLLDLIFDRIIAEQHVPDPEPERWQEQVKQIAHTMRATILRHRDVVRMSIGRIPMGPGALRYSERVLAILRAGGVPDDLAVLGHHLLISVVNGFTMDEAGEREPSAGPKPSSENAAAVARDYIASLPDEQFPNLVALADYYAIGDPDEHFALLLDLFVDGLAQHAASMATGQRSRTRATTRTRRAASAASRIARGTS